MEFTQEQKLNAQVVQKLGKCSTMSELIKPKTVDKIILSEGQKT
jgi:hypothetical protein